jgi:hypothetical protein
MVKPAGSGKKNMGWKGLRTNRFRYELWRAPKSQESNKDVNK